MKRRILLVDDELTILLTLKAVLEINGFVVETAASAREAKSKIKNHQYHMVITDMRMESEQSGVDVVKAAKLAPYAPAVAILTAFPVDDEWSEHGADEMLVKPMNVKDLVLQLEAMLVANEDKKQKAVHLAAAADRSAGKSVSKAKDQTKAGAARKVAAKH